MLVATHLSTHLRIRIFVDFWNFSLSLRRVQNGFKLDWRAAGKLFADEAGKLIDPDARSILEAIHIYGSFDPNNSNDKKLENWFSKTLNKMPGTHAELVERQQKRAHPHCPSCNTKIKDCPKCKGDMRGTEEKGVDTRIVTDMISLAWANHYDAAVIVSSDRDFIPVAKFLQSRGIKVVHGAFPPYGSDLSQQCWANFNIKDLMPQMELGGE